jgi:hypothetical protein
MTAILSPSRFLFLLLSIVCLVFAFAIGLSFLQTNQHAIDRHGEDAIIVASMFDSQGKCNLGSSVVMQNKIGQKLYICFEEEKKVNLHIESSEGRTITDIPAKQISKPWNYIPNVIQREGYAILRSFGDLPEWFCRLFK